MRKPHFRPHVHQLESEKKRMMQMNPSWAKTLKSPTGNWNVIDLLDRRRRRTLTRDWSVCLRKYRIVGTSTNCSASCGSRTEVRGRMCSTKILGTSITCSATAEKALQSTSCPTIRGTRASSVGRPGTASTICSTVCR